MTDNEQPNPLGIDTTNLGQLKPEDLRNKGTATIVLTYLASCEAEKAQLKTENETLKTYATSYQQSQDRAKIAATLSLLGTILIGIGINLITNDQILYGGIFTCAGVILNSYAIYLVYKK